MKLVVLTFFWIFSSLCGLGMKSFALEMVAYQVPVQEFVVQGKIVDGNGIPLPGATIIEKGTNNGVQSDFDGNFALEVSGRDAVLVVSFLGFNTQEVSVNGEPNVVITLEEDTASLDEVVVIGYGTQRKRDLTGAVTSIDLSDDLQVQPNVSIAQTLQGTVAGLNIGQVNAAGEEPNLSIRGRTSLSGAQNPLIVLDGVIFRGNLIDINPNDIKSIDILKDNSAAAVYGSQAANGVLIITTKTSGKLGEGPTINYSAKYSFQTPHKELRPGGAEHFIEKIREHEWRESRTEESGYIEPNPDFDVTSYFKTGEQADNYLAGMDTPWYDLLTNDNIYIHDQNVSISNRSELANYFVSLGFVDQAGFMLNEDYQRLNARINVDSDITDWLTVGIQSFLSTSDYSGYSPSAEMKYLIPFEAAYDENGNPARLIENTFVSPLIATQADNKDIRQSLFGNIYAQIDFPFLEGLSYRINASHNQITNRYYVFEPYANNFQGYGFKYHNLTNNFALDNRLNFNRRFNELHNLEFTLVYGIEKRNSDFTTASASNFVNDVLGYNALEFGDSMLQSVDTGAWEETSLFTMGRLFYSFKDRYLFTGTIRRDGFSGFGEKNKFGVFPSASVGWVVSEEPFFENATSVMDFLKLRLSYGSSGNRTIGRYQTLARVGGGYNYVDAQGNSIYTQDINGLASPNLAWETTTGVNIGVDFGFLKSRINGSLNYYNNNTTDLLYTVHLPRIGRFEEFPDNLGKLHNHGIELSISSINIRSDDFSWKTDFTFSRNRDELKELLGIDADGDGIEDDLISEGLFIGQPLNVIFDYQITGERYQFGDEIPSGYDVGTNIIVDQNDDGVIDPENDKIILGYRAPSYRFSIGNNLQYKNWNLNVFVNSIQGGNNYYMTENDLHELQYGDQFDRTYPVGYDNYWLPENPNAPYQKKSDAQPGNFRGKNFEQRSFIRLQDVSLTYRFGEDFNKFLGVNSLNLFFSGKNLLTITDWRGWDPETGQGISRFGSPVLESYTVGLNVQF